MARRTSQGVVDGGSTLPSGTAQPDLPPVEASERSNLHQRLEKSPFTEGRNGAPIRYPAPRTVSPVDPCNKVGVARLSQNHRWTRTPADLDIHIIADNYATHKHPAGQSMARTAIPAFHMHYTPTSSSWMNLVERFFRDPDRVHYREEALPRPETSPTPSSLF